MIAAARLRTAGRTLDQHRRRCGRTAVWHGADARRRGGRRADTASDGGAGAALVAALDAAIGGIQALGKATTGEKTMLDALVPAADGRAHRSRRADGPAEVADAMAEAAEAGAAATIPMLATKGRASYLGERSVGHQDPGATSSALLLRALAPTPPARPGCRARTPADRTPDPDRRPAHTI